jgi:hypothetical protein
MLHVSHEGGRASQVPAHTLLREKIASLATAVSELCPSFAPFSGAPLDTGEARKTSLSSCLIFRGPHQGSALLVETGR